MTLSVNIRQSHEGENGSISRNVVFFQHTRAVSNVKYNYSVMNQYLPQKYDNAEY